MSVHHITIVKYCLHTIGTVNSLRCSGVNRRTVETLGIVCYIMGVCCWGVSVNQGSTVQFPAIYIYIVVLQKSTSEWKTQHTKANSTHVCLQCLNALELVDSKYITYNEGAAIIWSSSPDSMHHWTATCHECGAGAKQVWLHAMSIYAKSHCNHLHYKA